MVRASVRAIIHSLTLVNYLPYRIIYVVRKIINVTRKLNKVGWLPLFLLPIASKKSNKSAGESTEGPMGLSSPVTNE